MSRLHLLLLLCLTLQVHAEHVKNFNPIYSEQSNLTVEKLNQATEVLQDPTLALEKIKQTFDRSSAYPAQESDKTPTNGSIKDPTQINGSFSAALRRLTSKHKGNEATSHALPEISLAAKTFSEDGKNSSALLSINKKIYFVKPGGSLSFMQDNEIYEIAVESIDIHSVRIRLSPLNETLILR